MSNGAFCYYFGWLTNSGREAPRTATCGAAMGEGDWAVSSAMTNVSSASGAAGATVGETELIADLPVEFAIFFGFRRAAAATRIAASNPNRRTGRRLKAANRKPLTIRSPFVANSRDSPSQS